MKLTAEVKDIRTRYIAARGLPSGSPETIDEIARAWAMGFAEQVRFQTKDPRWGMKRADLGRPIGKDTIAFNAATGLVCWDLLTGTGTGNPTLVQDPESIDIRDQVFVPVLPIDHLSGTTNPPVTPPPPSTKALTEYFSWRDRIRQLYREELKRDVIADPDALVNWLFHWRENNRDLAWIRARIQESEEWKAGHP